MAQSREGEPVKYVSFESQMPQSKFPPPLRVFSAGDNSLRHEWLKMCFPYEECTVLKYDVNSKTGEDTEPNNESESAVMRHKISVAYMGYDLNEPPKPAALGEIEHFNGEIYDPNFYQVAGDLIVGVDARTYVPKQGKLKSMGKPTSEQEIHLNFINMLNSSLNSETGEDPYYEVRAATGIIYIDQNQESHKFNKHKKYKVILDQQKLTGLVVGRFDEYIDRTTKFFSDKKTLSNISAGFSLEVLVQMGIVKGIQPQDEEIIERKNPYFRNALKQAIQHVAIGTVPELMEIFEGIDTTNIIEDWSFLEEATAKALREI